MTDFIVNKLRDLHGLQGEEGKEMIPFMLIQANGDPLVFSAATPGVFMNSPYVIVSSIKNDRVTVEVLAPVRHALLRTQAVIVLNLSNICNIQIVTNPVYDFLEVTKPFEQSLSQPFSLQEDERWVIWKALHNRNEDEADIIVTCTGDVKDLTVEISTANKDYSFMLDSGESCEIHVHDLLCITLCSGMHGSDGMLHLQIKSNFTETVCFL